MTGLMVVAAFHGLGLGPALLARAWTALPWRCLPVLTALGTASVSYVVFWIAFYAPATRIPVAAVAFCGSVGAASLALRTCGARMLGQPAVWAPPLVTVLLTALYLTPVLGSSGPSVNARFGGLPADNILPGLLAHRVATHRTTERPVPPLWPGGDRASERPPLQAAIVVGVGSLVPGGGGDEYQLLASLCQAQWLPVLWLMGAIVGLPRRRLVVVLVACAGSGFFFLNTIYTWPKLLAASLMLGALAVAMEAGQPRTDGRRTIVAAAFAAVSLLAHPGPLFTLIAIPFVWPLVRPLLRLRVPVSALLAATVSAATLAAPWLIYVTAIDPADGRLVREHLSDGRRTGSVAVDVVRATLERSAAEHVRVRVEHLASQIGDLRRALSPLDVAGARQEQFLRHGAALGVLMVGLVAACLPAARGTPDDAVRRLAMAALVALAVWCVLIFPRGGAVIHHGSPVTTVLLFFAGACGLTRLPRLVMLPLLAAHLAGWVAIWLLPVWRGPWGTA